MKRRFTNWLLWKVIHLLGKRIEGIDSKPGHLTLYINS